MSDRVAAAVAHVSDPLYARIAAKVEKKRFPGGVPASAPLDGLDEAIEQMATEVDSYVQDDTISKFRFFNDQDECLPVPCTSCTPAQDPRLTKWWASVHEWSEGQRKREREVTEQFGDLAGVRFQSKRKRNHQRLRTAVHKAWTAKYPLMNAKWRTTAQFEVEWDEQQESNE